MNLVVRTTMARHFALPAERIFDAWLNPSPIGGGPIPSDARNHTVIRSGIEARIGGRLSLVISRREAEIEFSGNYLEIDRPHLLVFTWGLRGSSPTRRVIVEILPLVHGCELTLTQVMLKTQTGIANEEPDFWQEKLEALADLFAAAKIPALSPP